MLYSTTAVAGILFLLARRPVLLFFSHDPLPSGGVHLFALQPSPTERCCEADLDDLSKFIHPRTYATLQTRYKYTNNGMSKGPQDSKQYASSCRCIENPSGLTLSHLPTSPLRVLFYPLLAYGAVKLLPGIHMEHGWC